MSMLTTVYLIERYGLRLSMEQLAQVLGLAVATLLEFAAAERAKIGGLLASEPELPNWLRADLLFVNGLNARD